MSLHKPRFITIAQKDKEGEHMEPWKTEQEDPTYLPTELSKGKLGEIKYRRGKRLENFLEPQKCTHAWILESVLHNMKVNKEGRPRTPKA